jgi:hypothetical protein
MLLIVALQTEKEKDYKKTTTDTWGRYVEKSDCMTTYSTSREIWKWQKRLFLHLLNLPF